VRATLANRVSVLRHKLATQLCVAQLTREAVFVPVFAKCSGNYVIHISVASCTYPTIKALLVKRLPVLDNVLTSDTPITFRAREEISRTIRAQSISMVLKESTGQWLAAIIASEVMQVESLTHSIHILSLKLLSTMVARIRVVT